MQKHTQAHTHTHNLLSLPHSLSDRFRLKSIMSRGRHQSSRSGASVIQTTYELICHSEKTPERSLSCLRHVEQNNDKQHACIYSQFYAMLLKFCAVC